MMSDSEKKGIDEDGVLIKKKDESAKDKGKIEQELPIDNLDSGGTDQPTSVTEKKSEISATQEQEGKTFKKNLLEGLDEEEIATLLAAKQTLEEQNQLLEDKNRLLLEYEDLLKRKQADFENFRKRMQKESEEHKKYAISEIVLDIITVIDNFERAVESAEQSKDFNALHEGILMIEKQLKDLLEKKYAVKMIETVGREFDPTLHDAVMMEESDEYDEDTVVEDFQKGYVMHDRVIRPAKVKVAKSVSSVEQGNSNQNENEEGESPDKD